MIDNEQLNLIIKTIEESNKNTIEEANRKQSEDLKLNIKKDIHDLKVHFQEELNKKSAEFDNKYKELEIKYKKLEKELRKNNIIIFGLESPTDNLVNFIINELNKRLGLTLTPNDINTVYTIGKQSTKKPIILKLLSYIKKQEIFANSKKLKGTGISIAEDLTIEERKENKILRDHLKIARNKKLNAYIKYGKLIINGQQYSAQELINQEDSSTEEEDSVTEKTKQDQELYEAKIAAIRLNNSDPPTPNKVGEEAHEEDEVFENIQSTSKRKTIKVNHPIKKIVRASVRLNSNREQQKKNNVYLSTPLK